MFKRALLLASILAAPASAMAAGCNTLSTCFPAPLTYNSSLNGGLGGFTFSLPPSGLTQQGATSGQVITWSGSQWAPAAAAGSGGSASFPGTTSQLLDASGTAVTLGSGVALNASTHTLTGNSTPVTTIAASGTAQTLTFPASGNAAYDITKTGNVALTLIGGTAGQYQTITLIVRPGAGGFTETLPPGVRWGGATPTPSTSGINVYFLSTPDGGATVFGSY